MCKLTAYLVSFALSVVCWGAIGWLVGWLWRTDRWAVGGLLLAGVLLVITLMPRRPAA